MDLDTLIQRLKDIREAQGNVPVFDSQGLPVLGAKAFTGDEDGRKFVVIA